jgi:hypothetical protein
MLRDLKASQGDLSCTCGHDAKALVPPRGYDKQALQRDTFDSRIDIPGEAVAALRGGGAGTIRANSDGDSFCFNLDSGF